MWEVSAPLLIVNRSRLSSMCVYNTLSVDRCIENMGSELPYR